MLPFVPAGGGGKRRAASSFPVNPAGGARSGMRDEVACGGAAGIPSAQVMSDSDYGPGPLSGNPPSVAGCPG
ncbi:hypothetical protein SSCG_03104 [Streptomyces clavuligerus]|nr:hypothetical protein SSCG_03104 [Streptomyces clavuligerus]